MHLRMSYSELLKMPIRYRHWFVKRLSKHFDQKTENTAGTDNGNRDMPSLARIEEFINKKTE